MFLKEKNNPFAENDDAIDALFADPLTQSNPTLPGEVQKLDWHMFRKRARQMLQDYRTRGFVSGVLLITSILMFSTSHRDDEGGWENLTQVVLIASLSVAIVEFVVYGIGHGFIPQSKIQRSSAGNSRIQSILSVWSPVRFRQKKVTIAGQLLAQKPFLDNYLLCVEAILVVVSIVGYFLPGGNNGNGFSRLRYVHGLRCLRLMSPLTTVIPSVTFLVDTFKSSMSLLIPASSFLAFFFILFGVISVDQFKGDLSHRCVMINPRHHETINFTEYTADKVCLSKGRPVVDDCVDAIPLTFCDRTSSTESFAAPIVCKFPMVCRDRGAPNLGYTNFDNIFNAWLTMFHISSLSSWSGLMYGLWASTPRIFVGGFCVLLIVVVAFIIFNFVVAIITTSYSKARASMKMVEALASGRKKGASMLNYRLSEFVWWSFSPQIVHHLGFSPDGKDRGRRLPFYEDMKFRALRNIWICFIVIVHAINGTHMPSDYQELLRQFELANISLFTVEFVFSVLASGSLGKYLSNGWRRFDSLVYILTIAGVSMYVPLSVIRSFRIIRHARKIGFVRKRQLLRNTLAAGSPALVVTSFLVVCMYVMTAVAIQLFSNTPEATEPKEHFNTPFVALTTMFRLTTMDQPFAAMYHAMKQQHWLIGLLFFVPAYILFGYMLSSLFTAVVIDSFEPHKEDKMAWQRRKQSGEDLEDEDDDLDDEAKASRRAERIADAKDDTPTKNDEQMQEVVEVQRVRQTIVDKSFSLFSLENKLRKAMIKIVVDPNDTDAPADPKEEPPKLYGNVFQWIIMLFVVWSCVMVALLPAADACSAREERTMQKISVSTHIAWDIVFVIIFFLEMVMKMIAHGVLFPGDDRPSYIGKTYFRDVWNLLDFFLLVAMMVSFFYPQAKSLRLIRALRPLRVVRRVESMRYLVKGVIRSIPNIAILFIFATFCLFVFGVIGVGLFQGKMNYCTATIISGSPVVTRSDCKGMYFNDDGVLTIAAWTRPTAHFDHVGAAMAFLLEVTSLSQFDALLTQAVNIVGKDLQPQPEYSLQYTLFFFVFVILAAFFILNVVVGVLLATLDEQRGILFLTANQKDWFTIKKEITKLKPLKPPPKTKFVKIQRLIGLPVFDIVVNVAVFLNIITISSVHRDQSDGWTAFQYYSNIVFLVIFLLEAILKILALGKHYFKDPWNLIDFTVVLGSLFEFTYQLASSNSKDVTITSAGRAFRILRIFRSVKRVPSLRGLFLTLAYSLPAIVSITGFLFIILFMYALVGMNLFGHIRFQEHLNKDANFRSVEFAFFTLFRMVTLDGWNTIMSDVRKYTSPFCAADEKGWWYVDKSSGENLSCGTLNDCSSQITQLYFFSFYSIGAFLFLNLLIAILLDNFNYISTQARSVIRAHHLDSYQLAWLNAKKRHGISKNYDPYIDPSLFSGFIIDLFNADNALVRCDTGVHIHPVLTAASRLNFKKLEYEIQHNGKEEGLPESRRFTFSAIVSVCARMQMGKESLTYRHKVEREAFEEEQTLAIIGPKILSMMDPIIQTVKQRVAERVEIRRKYGDENEAESPSAAAALGEPPTHPSLRRTARQTLEPRHHGTSNDVKSPSDESPVTNNSNSHSPNQSRQTSFRKIVSFRNISFNGESPTPNHLFGGSLREELVGSLEAEEYRHRLGLVGSWKEQLLEIGHRRQRELLCLREAKKRSREQLSFLQSMEHGFRTFSQMVEESVRKQLDRNLKIALWSADSNAVSGSAAGYSTMRTDVGHKGRLPQQRLPLSSSSNNPLQQEMEMKNPISNQFGASEPTGHQQHSTLPFCPDDLDCGLYHQTEHQQRYIHTCRNGLECRFQSILEHAKHFFHTDLQDVIEMDVME